MEVLVLGNGIIGLWTADILSRAGHQVVMVARSVVQNTTSAAAVSVLNPTFPGDPSSPVFRRNVRWAAETREYMLVLDRDKPFLEKISTYEFGAACLLEDDFPISNLDHLGLESFSAMEFEEPVAGYDLVVKFDCLLCNSRKFLTRLHQGLLSRDVKLRQATISAHSDLDEFDARIVFNCMGYQKIFPDADLYPVFGQSMVIPALKQPGPHFGLGAGDNAVYVHGGGIYIGSHFAYIEGQAPRRDLYQASLDFIASEYRDLCDLIELDPPDIDLNGIRIVQSGVRPFRRSGPLVALERIGPKTVVHNYGHGAHGWTVGYAAALEGVVLAGLC
jgi:glycine/D-amino acid oxidase-like deaminating enzyme